MDLKFYSYEKAVFGSGPGTENILKESNPSVILRMLGHGSVKLDGKGEETMYFRSVQYPNVRYFTKDLTIRNSF
jgi:hypothetical protein